MKINIPTCLQEFSEYYSKLKTPSLRTQGWKETESETRGVGDVIDTIGSMVLFEYLVSQGVPATYMFTAGEGDAADLMVRHGSTLKSVNVKTSLWQPSYHDNPDRSAHIGIKEIEISKGLSDLYVQVTVHHSTDSPHVHLGNWIESGSPEFLRQEITTIPNSRGTRGYWIPTKDSHSIDKLPPHLLR